MNNNLEHDSQQTAHDIVELGGARRPPVLHRLAKLRQEKGISCREMARRLGINIEQVRLHEEATDLSVGTLNQWAEALGVHVTDLIVEPEEWREANYLARTKAERLLRLATELRDHSRRRNIQRLAQTFVDQLVEIEPSLSPPTNLHRRRKPSTGGNVPPRSGSNGKPSRFFDPPKR